MRAMLDLFPVFVRRKIAINENVRIIDHASRIPVPGCSKSTINRNIDDDVIIRSRLSSNIFEVVVI